MEIVLGVIVIVVIVAAIVYWYISIPLGVIIYLCVRSYLKEKQEKERKEQERRMQESRELHRQNLEHEVQDLVSEAQTLSTRLPTNINTAKSYIDRARQYFKDEAFAPFWDSIESAVTSLAMFRQGVETITERCGQYKTRVAELNYVPAAFDWNSATDGKVAAQTAEELRSLVYAAQRNFQFASIYEQRKTNQLLSVGFATLAQAISEIGSRIESSIGLLDMTVTSLSDTVAKISERSVEVETTNIQVIQKQIATGEEARRIHEEREEKLLTAHHEDYRKTHGL